MKRSTLKNQITLSGVGIHSGKNNQIRLCPTTKSGIRFICEYAEGAIVPVTVSSLSHTNRATILKCGSAFVQTPEHLLSACVGMGLTDVDIVMSEPEICILDGSALPFAEAIAQTGLELSSEEIEPFYIRGVSRVGTTDVYIEALPSDHFEIEFILEYSDSFIKTQTASYLFSHDTYITDIAPARTYGFEHEVKALLAQGLAKGGSFDNALIIGEEDYACPLRFPNELARHKILDVIGDLSVLGPDIRGRFVCRKSGHHLNMELVKQLNP